MGLLVTHGCWEGAYSSFHHFRAALVEAAGGSVCPSRIGGYVLDGISQDDPLMVLVTHSDCDGEISVEQGARLAPRLRELADLIPEGPEQDRWMEEARQFARGLEVAGRAGEAVRFE